MKKHNVISAIILLTVSAFTGVSAANANSTPLTAAILNNPDKLTQFARNLDHNDVKLSDAQMQSYVYARMKTQVQHDDQHLQAEKNFVQKYGKDRDENADVILDQYVQH